MGEEERRRGRKKEEEQEQEVVAARRSLATAAGGGSTIHRTLPPDAELRRATSTPMYNDTSGCRDEEAEPPTSTSHSSRQAFTIPPLHGITATLLHLFFLWPTASNHDHPMSPLLLCCCWSCSRGALRSHSSVCLPVEPRSFAGASP